MEYQILKKLIFLIALIPILSQAQSFSFLITEIMYNPEGNDVDREWIEVFNQSNQVFYLKSGRSGWRINDGENHLFKDEITIYPQEVFVIVQDKNKFLSEYPDFKGKLVPANFSLKNSSGRIQILDENKNLLAEISYEQNCGGNDNGYSIIFKNGICQENRVKKGTPGIYPELELLRTENIQQNQSPSQQTDTSQQTTAVSSTPIFSNFQTTTSEQTLISTSTLVLTSTIQEIVSNQVSSEKSTPLTLYITEFLPNPQGNDSGQEFVELYNYGDEEINLDGFILEIGKKKIKLKGVIEPKEYFIVTNKDYNFYIRNQGENLALYFQNQKIFSISYQGKAPEGKSFSRFEDDWQFTEPTPGQENKLVFEKASRSFNKSFEEKIKPETDSLALANPQKSTKIEDKNNIILILIGSLIFLFVLSVLVFIRL